jgi:hypothetical protein
VVLSIDEDTESRVSISFFKVLVEFWVLFKSWLEKLEIVN